MPVAILSDCWDIVEESAEYGSIEAPKPCTKGSENVSKKRPLKRIDIVAIATLLVIMYCNRAAISVMVSFFPIEAQKRHVSATVTGFIFGVLYFVCFVTAPIVGYLIPKVGSKRLLIIGSLGNAIATILFGLIEYSPHNDELMFVLLCFGARILQAVSNSTVVGVVYAFYPTKYPDRTGLLVGLTEACNGLGLMSGPFIGGALYEASGFGLPFYVIGGLGFIASVSAIFSLSTITDSPHTSTTSFRDLLSHLDMILVLGTAVTDSFAQMFLEPVLANHLQGFSLSPLIVGTVILSWTVLYVIAAPIYGKICEMYGYLMTMMISSTTVMCLCLLIMGPAPFLYIKSELWTTVVALSGMGLAGGGTYVAPLVALLIITINHGYPDNLATYSLVAGLFNGAYSLGGFAGSSLAGVMVDFIGFPWACVCVAGLFVINITALVAYSIKHRKPKQDIFTKTYRPIVNDAEKDDREVTWSMSYSLLV